MADRRGFVLLTVLWTLAGASMLAIVVALEARDSIEVTSNDMAAARAYWGAEACASRTIDAATRVLTTTAVDDRDPQRAWRNLDRLVAGIADTDATGRCATQLRSYGDRIDLARVTAAELRALLTAIGLGGPRGDSLVAAALDWRDEDDQPREVGAERRWYAANGRLTPRNGNFASPFELLRVRGFDALGADQDSLLVRLVDANADLVDLWHAPVPVLRTLPGFSPTVADAVVALREQTAGASDLAQLAIQLPRPARDSVEANFDRLVTRAATQPAHWLLTSLGRSGVPSVTVHLELLLATSNGRIAIVRRRYWVE